MDTHRCAILLKRLGLAWILFHACSAPVAFAWTASGHHLIARLASAQLPPHTREAVQALLASEPGASLESIAHWADDSRDRDTAAWHYVNFPRGNCQYEPDRDCPEGRCVVGALTTQLDVLSSSASAGQRLTALKYVVHLAADIHQPLHAGFGHDRGGNGYPVQAQDISTNLHALWDTGLGLLNPDRVEAVERDLARPLNSSPIEAIPPSIQQMAEESCNIVALDGFYPGHRLEPAYVERFSPVVMDRLHKAGQRLAHLLEKAF